MKYKCYFCDSNDIKDKRSQNNLIPNSILKENPNYYFCPRCGIVHLDRHTAEEIPCKDFEMKAKQIISICLRKKYEENNKMEPASPLKTQDLIRFIEQYTPLNPLEKMDNALLLIEKSSSYVGEQITINCDTDYPYYHCFGARELRSILSLLSQEGLIIVPDLANPHDNLSISVKGYQKLSEIKKYGKDSRQCFVAMWFTPEMNNVFGKAIKPAIEYKEEGKTEPRFRAFKIDNVEHLNDINDKIIAEIRRSRFMVCDLTGHRGGVYFEAGFAKGLGLEVIYTCRKDWLESASLSSKEGIPIDVLYDSKGKEIKIKKEGIHFDIEHINRIEWEEDKLPIFEEKLRTRIKANIL